MRLAMKRSEIPEHLLKYFKPIGHKTKDLVNIPHMVAEALREDGWYLRSAITWCKRAPMPESVTDRPTSATEQIFLLTKSQKYYYDQESVREPHTREWWGETVNPTEHVCIDRNDGGNRQGCGTPAGRNMWNYWILSPEPYTDAHFATFPTEIPRRAILAGSSERGCCPKCGKPFVRVLERSQPDKTTTRGTQRWASETGQRDNSGGLPLREAITLGWQPSCKCGGEPIPCTILDPFAGAGTTLMVADRLGRDAIGIELNPDYAAMAEARIKADAPMFAKVEIEATL